MKIVKLTAENIKRIKVVEITPKGTIVTISGKNGAGKSSVLDAIFWALAGAKNIQGKPIRDGQETARIRLDLGEIIVERKITAKASTVTVSSADGAQFPSPQHILDGIVGAIAFDPLEFTRQDPVAQVATLKALMPESEKIDRLTGQNKTDFDTRRDLNRQIEIAEKSALAITVPPNTPPELIDTKALLARILAGDAIKRQVEDYHRAHNAKLKLVDELSDKLKALQKEIAYEREKLAELETVPLPTVPDVEALRTELGDAENTNFYVHRLKDKAEKLADVALLQAQAKTLTDRMDDRKKQAAALIAGMKMPVEGMAFGDDGVTFQDRPFAQASMEEQIRISTAIAMAMNPKLRVLRIKEGSLLDSDALAALGSVAKDKDFQVWIEVVDSSKKVGIVIEDGSVVADNQQGLL